MKQSKQYGRINGRGDVQMALFVAGMTPRSSRAILNAKALCEAEFGGHYNLEVIDIYVEPVLAIQEQVYAVPLLIRYTPSPERRVIGDLSDVKQVRRSLGLMAA